MKNINLTNKLILILGIITLLLTIIIYWQTNFDLPVYYIDKHLVQQLASNVDLNKEEFLLNINKLKNPKYNLLNILYQIWGWVITLFLFSLVFKIKNFKTIIENRVFNNKLFIFLWINIIYLAYSICYWYNFKIDLNSYVYYWTSDSIMIPMIIMLSMIFIFGIYHYVINNLLTFITYNTKCKHIALQIIWIINGILTLLLIICDTISKFTYLNIFINCCNLVWLVIIICSIKYLKNKPTE